MKTKFLFFFILLLFHTKFMFSAVISPDGQDGSIVVETSFFVSKAANMTLPGSLLVKHPNTFKNEGNLFFKNGKDGLILFPEGELGTGNFVFRGLKDIELNIDGGKAQIGTLKMEMSSGKASLSGELSVTGKLDLKLGIIEVAQNGILKVDNPIKDAILFSNTPNSKSYVSGFLSRRVTADQDYIFPVGDLSSFHPFLLNKSSIDDVVSVAFDRNVPGEIEYHVREEIASIGKSLGWRVESEMETQNKFIAGLSLLNTSLDSYPGNLNVFYFSDKDLKGSASEVKVSESFVVGNEAHSSGLYAFSMPIVDAFVNFLYVKGENKTTFEIPNVGDYSNISLKVYNHLGSLVFKNNHYQNDFDARNFPEGTYYYELTLEKNNRRSVIRKFIDITHER